MVLAQELQLIVFVNLLGERGPKNSCHRFMKMIWAYGVDK